MTGTGRSKYQGAQAGRAQRRGVAQPESGTKKVMDQRFPPQQDVEPDQINDLAFQLPVGLLDVLMVSRGCRLQSLRKPEISVRNLLLISRDSIASICRACPGLLRARRFRSG